MRSLITTLGQVGRDAAGTILAHEHVFVDLRTPEHPAHGQARTPEVVEVMTPELHKARAAGIGAIVEASTLGVGRRADILRAVSESARLPLVVPTGVYREPWIPAWVHQADEEELFQWMRGELGNRVVNPTQVPSQGSMVRKGDRLRMSASERAVGSSSKSFRRYQ